MLLLSQRTGSQNAPLTE